MYTKRLFKSIKNFVFTALAINKSSRIYPFVCSLRHIVKWKVGCTCLLTNTSSVVPSWVFAQKVNTCSCLDNWNVSLSLDSCNVIKEKRKLLSWYSGSFMLFCTILTLLNTHILEWFINEGFIKVIAVCRCYNCLTCQCKDYRSFHLHVNLPTLRSICLHDLLNLFQRH